MRTKKYLLCTLKENPNDSEIISHQLMLRSGMIRKLSSGIYIWLPTGLRVLRKIENIIREEMNNIGAIEILMPLMQPIDIWKKSGRLKKYGSELLSLKDRSKKSFILGPTNEEIISNIMRNEINSYKELPLNFYQIQNKFRDEIRPRSGLIRSKEFLMKDAYSFHINKKSLKKTYNLMYETYKNIFHRMNLEFCIVKADNGTIGGKLSHEFHILSKNGEDKIAFSTVSDYAANIELAEVISPKIKRNIPNEKLRIINTSKINNNNELINKFMVPKEKVVKTILVHASKNSTHPFIGLIIRNDHELSINKAEKCHLIKIPLKIASKEEIYKITGNKILYIGPLNLPFPLIIDKSVALMSDFIAGSNIKGKHYFGINWKRDLPLPNIFDLRKVVDGDISPDKKGFLKIKKGIEIGHIFQLGTKYSKKMKINLQDKNGKNKILHMGCYGIGITRLVSAVIEQHHDDNGIIWPETLSPFNVAILPINMYKSSRVKKTAENLYFQLKKKNIDVIIDDRKENPGVIFSDMELIGIPHLIIIGDRNLNNKEIEYKNRKSKKKKFFKINKIIDYLYNKIII